MGLIPMEYEGGVLLTDSNTKSATSSSEAWDKICEINLTEGTWFISGSLSVNVTNNSQNIYANFQIAGENHYIDGGARRNGYGTSYSEIVKITSATTYKFVRIYGSTNPNFSGNNIGYLEAYKLE